MRQLKIGTSGVRGVVGDAMTPELIVNFACAFGTYCDGGTVVVGRDTRPSSVMLHSAVLAALISTGAQVIDLGVCPTPAVSFGVRSAGAAGGISITGSHNDANWNALKFIGSEGALLNAANSEELLDIYHASAFLLAPWPGLRRPCETTEPVERYVAGLCRAVDSEVIRARRFRVAVDFCNGAATAVGRRVLADLGCSLIPLNDDAGGSFAHAPAPSPDNMRQLAALMRSVDADLGAALNVDGDRIGFVTSDGTALSEELALPLVARHIFRKRPGPVVTNLSTSRMVELVAREHGRDCIRTMVGEGHVMDRALTDRAAVAGEGNGGVGVLPDAPTFDALLTLATVLEAAATEDCDFDALVSRAPRLFIRKAELPCGPDSVYRALDMLRARYADTRPDLSDGIRFDWPDAWLHIRASNTEPLLRVIAEADTEVRADQLFDQALTTARRAVWAHGGRQGA